ncbi:MAG: tetratricopeptide repeat protein [Verrucomicrobiota bacterium]|jgi:tetratricopeptide (TPR) repeat protein
MKRLCHCIGPVLLLALLLGTAGGCTKQARVHRHLKAGNDYFAAEKYDNAELEYKDVLHLGVMNPMAIGQLGRLYAKEGRLADARVCLRKAVELLPNSLAFQLALGQVDLSFRDTNAAMIARRILSAQPTNEEALILLVDSSRNAKQTQLEVETLPRAAENPAYHLALGVLAMRQRSLDEAGNELGLALAARPNSSQTYFFMAELSILEKNEAEAARDFKMAAEFAPMRSIIRTRYADYLAQRGAAEDARKLLVETTQKVPDFIPGWIGLMNLALSGKEYDEAAKCADTVLERDPMNYDALLCRGSVYLARGEAAKALESLEHMDSLYKKSPEVKYELAVGYLMAQDKIKGMAHLDQALALDPFFGKAILLQARLDIRGGDPASAVVLLTRLLKKAPNVVEARTLLAEAYLAQQRPDAAIAVYRDLAEAMPADPQIQFVIGVVQAGQHNYAEARLAFEKSLQIAPAYLPAAEQLINLDLAGRNYKEAAALAREQIDKSPKAAEPWEIMAKIDLAQTNAAHAETDLLNAIQLNPDLPSPYLLVADVYCATGKYEEALQKLNGFVARTNDVAAFLQIGAIHEKLKQFDAAGEAYEKALSVGSNSVPVLNNLAYLYSVRLNKIDKAFELAQKARDLAPNNPNVGDTLGWILFKKGDYSHALSILQDSSEKDPASAEIQFHLGITYCMMDDEADARVALQRAVASPEDYATKDEARSRLALLDADTAGPAAKVMAGLEKALQDYPGDPVILNRIGTVEERQGAFEKAAAAYEAALQKNGEAVPIMAKLAGLYATRLSQPDKALRLATAAHKLAPDNAGVSAILGRLVYHNGDYAWALSLLESAADRQPNQPELLYDLAWAYYAVGRVPEAHTAMQKALQSGVGFAESDAAKRFVALTDALGSAGGVQAAAGQARRILQAEAKYVPALMVSGAAQESGGDLKGARESYGQALEVFPQFAPAARQLAILDAEHFTDDDHGYALAEQARTAYPDDPAVAKSLGILSFYKGNYARSAELLGETLSQSKKDGELYCYLGLDEYRLKRSKESKQALERALALGITDKLAAEAKRILAEVK